MGSMNKILTSEDNISNLDKTIPVGTDIIYFKIVKIGPNTLKECNYLGSNIYNVAQKQKGFFILTDPGHNIKEEMYTIIDKFCGDNHESKN